MENTLKLVYKNNFTKNSYSLIELGTKELQEAFESGEKIEIKGLADDEAVLCTDSKTFIVRQVNTSNSILLVEKDVNNKHIVHDDMSNTIELLPCLARLNRIDGLLEDTRYSGYKNEKDLAEKKFYSYHELLSIVQASENEILDGLKSRGAFEYNGYFRLFERSYLFRLFDSLITNAQVNTIDISKMTLNQAKKCILDEMNAIDEEEIVPDDILLACINSFITDSVELEDELLKFDEYKICRFLGEWLLTNPRNKRWEMNDFMEVWKKLGQDIFIPKLEFIEGLCVLHENIKLQKTEKFIQYFPRNELSSDPAQRFSTLFSEKALWTPEEINPFLVDLAPNKKDREHLLLKFARMHRDKNLILYGSRIK